MWSEKIEMKLNNVESINSIILSNLRQISDSKEASFAKDIYDSLEVKIKLS